MHSRGQKKKVAYYARHHGIRKAASQYGIHHRNVQRWVKNKVAASPIHRNLKTNL
jgi:transposase-like protein